MFLIPSLTNEKTVDRLSILVSGERVLKFLADPVTDSEAESTANTISKVVKECRMGPCQADHSTLL